jgi:stearoyl-CoA desaturase (delta-9 desaturase)
MATATAAGKNASPFPDGTKDYVPLRAGASKKDANKVHIADTPMTWSNWPQHINWLNTTLVIFVPLMGFISAYWVPLQLKTALWAVFYYVHTGLGITAGKLNHDVALLPPNLH